MLHAADRMHLITENLTVENNACTVIYTSNAFFTESDSVFRNNSANNLTNLTTSGSCYYGTAISEAKFTNTIFESNWAYAKGGAIYISVGQTNAYFHSITATQNTAEKGAFIYAQDDSSFIID